MIKTARQLKDLIRNLSRKSSFLTNLRPMNAS